jgi:hypothetical protein
MKKDRRWELTAEVWLGIVGAVCIIALFFVFLILANTASTAKPTIFKTVSTLEQPIVAPMANKS